jgi:hypothetical protein
MLLLSAIADPAALSKRWSHDSDQPGLWLIAGELHDGFLYAIVLYERFTGGGGSDQCGDGGGTERIRPDPWSQVITRHDALIQCGEGAEPYLTGERWLTHQQQGERAPRMNLREELRRLVDGLDVRDAKQRLHVLVDELGEETARHILAHVTDIRRQITKSDWVT